VASSSAGSRNHMSWKTPKVIEIALGAEINSYACAEAKK
jgi:coenzyme PQQ precursor peptide PqqA